MAKRLGPRGRAIKRRWLSRYGERHRILTAMRHAMRPWRLRVFASVTPGNEPSLPLWVTDAISARTLRFTRLPDEEHNRG